MKNFTFLHRTVVLLLSATFLFSCKKEINEPKIDEVIAAFPDPGHDCDATVFAVLTERPDGVKTWHNLMQRWYGSDDKVQYLKAMLSNDFNTYSDFHVRVEWGEVTYHNNNQVYLRDVLRNKQVMRVTTDVEGRPLASYFHNEPGPGQVGFVDTSYYHWTGDRLDEILSFWHTIPSPTPHQFAKYKFIYDGFGNLIRIEDLGPSRTRMHFKYDYEKEVTDMIGAHYLNYPTKLLEYMDLLHIPVHHQLTKVVYGTYMPGSHYPDETFPIEEWQYDHSQLDENRLVWSYMDLDGAFKKTYYTGWECDNVISAPPNNNRTIVESVEEFKRRFPLKKKDK